MTTARVYPHARERGLATWNPRRETLALLEDVKEILVEYEEHLPLTARQLFYRLVGSRDYPKDENAYARLLHALGRARRAGLLSFEAIRDDGVQTSGPGGYCGMAHFWEAVRSAAGSYYRDRSAGQPVALEVWVEAGGMVPQVARVAHSYGATVFSSGGFDSLTAKHDAARRILERDRSTIVLHVGDHDPSGVSLFDSAAEDVGALVLGLALREGRTWTAPVFERVAVTEEQIESYSLPSAPPKKTDKRGDWKGETVQAEALTPDQLAYEIRVAVEAHVDFEVLSAAVDREDEERAALVETLENIRL